MCRRLFDALDEVGERIAQSLHLLLCLDFDGTLAAIAKDPAVVFLSPRMKMTVESLSKCANTSVAIISGRDRADLQARVDIPGLIYAGNHGLEISGPGFIFIEPGAVANRMALQELAADLARHLGGIPGAFVEDKGLTVSVHYRQVAPSSWEQIRQMVESALSKADDAFLLTCGDKVYEVRPRVTWNKGTAVGWIKKQLGQPNALVIYLGDDVTDEDAFRALAEDITIKVGSSLETSAHYQLNGPVDVQKFLEWLAQCRITEEL
jgi:trehalose 6-phosphate phosphatase